MITVKWLGRENVLTALLKSRVVGRELERHKPFKHIPKRDFPNNQRK